MIGLTGGRKDMVELNSTLFIQIVNFIFLIFILNQLLYKPIIRVVNERKQLVSDAQEEANRLGQSVEQKTAEYEEKLKYAQKESAVVREQLKNEGSEQAKAIMQEATREVAGIVDEFKGKIADEQEKARQVLRKKTQKIAAEISEKILGRTVQ